MNLIAILASTLIATSHAPQRPTTKPVPSKDKVVAVVDGFPIHASDIEAELWDWHGYEVMQEAIVNRIIDQKAVGAKLTATDAEIQAAYNAQLEQIKANVGASGDVDTALKERGGSRSRVWLGARREVLLAKLLGAQWQAKDFVSVSTLLVQTASAAASDVGAALAKANEAYSRLQKGDPWPTIFAKYNVNPKAPNDGALGYVQIAKFPEVTQKELPTLKAGQFTKPVQTPYGFQLFRIEKFGKDASATDMANLKNQFVTAQKRTYLDGLIQSAKITRGL